MNNHIHTNASVNRYDPTRTTALRNAFVKDMNRRFDGLVKIIYKTIVTEDAFGLNNKITIQGEFTTPSRASFAFPRSADKVEKFRLWLDKQIKNGILEVGELNQIGSGINGAWTNKYIFDSYKRGVIRARYELKQAKYKDIPAMEQTGGIVMSMTSPLHIDRLGLLYTRAFSELQGITSQMDTQISRVLSQGIADGDNPITLARKMRKVITGTSGTGKELAITDTLGRFIPAKRRAEMIARTEIIRAHHVATIQEYKTWATEGVYIRGEWKTSGILEGPGHVCDECLALEGHMYDLDEIESMIPYHPNCKCIALPIRVEKGNKYKRTNGEILTQGGEGSGNFGHLGRPGEVGGSGEGGGKLNIPSNFNFEKIKNGKYADYIYDNENIIMSNSDKLLENYTRRLYVPLNEDLRNENKDDDTLFVKNELNKAMENYPKYEGITYRAMQLNESESLKFISNLKNNNQVEFLGFTSTSKEKYLSRFLGENGTIVLKINGKNGRDITNISHHKEGGETEILFKSNSKFKYQSHKLKTQQDNYGHDLFNYYEVNLKEL